MQSFTLERLEVRLTDAGSSIWFCDSALRSPDERFDQAIAVVVAAGCAAITKSRSGSAGCWGSTR